MIEKCENCLNKISKLFGHCQRHFKITEAHKLLTEVDIDDSNLQFNCKFYQPIPVLAAVTVFVFRNQSFLLGKRLGSHGEGTWGLPGGKIDFGENWFNAAQREVLEETGLQTENFKFHGLTNDVFTEDKKHFVNIIITCTSNNINNQPRVIEPTKCECWDWVDIKKVNNIEIDSYAPLFLSLVNTLKTVDVLNLYNSHQGGQTFILK